MDINQQHLKSLLNQTDAAFEQYKLHPASDEYAQAYEQAKTDLDKYMQEIRLSIGTKE